MREHVDEVEDDDVERILAELVESFEESLGIDGVVHLGITKVVVSSIACNLRPDEFFFVEVFALVFVLIHP